MSNYSKSFVVGWTIGFIFLAIFNILLFFAPVLGTALLDMAMSLGVAGLLLLIVIWPVWFAALGLEVFGFILAIVVDVIVLSIFYAAQKKALRQNDLS